MGKVFAKGVNGNDYDTNELLKYYVEYHMYVQTVQ